jgi:hypothetical protein
MKINKRLLASVNPLLPPAQPSTVRHSTVVAGNTTNSLGPTSNHHPAMLGDHKSQLPLPGEAFTASAAKPVSYQ